MAIRFKHDVGAGIIGAYAAGQAEARRRREKYSLALYQQEREHQLRMQERLGGLQYRAALGGGRGGDGATAGAWVDPADNPFLTEEERIKLRVKQRAQRRAAARGAGAPTDALPYWRSGEEIKAQRDREAEDRKRQQEIEDREDQQEAIAARAKAGQEATAAAARLRDQIAFAQDEEKTIEQDIANNRYSKEDAAELRKKQREIRNTLSSKRFSDEAQREAELAKLRAERDDIFARRLPEETLADKIAKGVEWTTGPDGRKFPVVIGSDGKPQVMSGWKPSDDAAKEAAKVAARQQKIFDNAQKKMKETETDNETPKYKSFTEALAAAQAEVDEAEKFFNPPESPAQPGGYDLAPTEPDYDLAPTAGGVPVEQQTPQRPPVSKAPLQPGAPAGQPPKDAQGRGPVRAIPGSNPPAWEMPDGVTVFQQHDGSRVWMGSDGKVLPPGGQSATTGGAKKRYRYNPQTGELEPVE